LTTLSPRHRGKSGRTTCAKAVFACVVETKMPTDEDTYSPSDREKSGDV
jgi:hypothetical protein